MKKVIAAIMATLILISSITVYGNEQGSAYGDVNMDNAVNASDALLVLKHASKLTILDKEQIALANVNEDSSVNASDALLILKFAAQLIDKLPIDSAGAPSVTEAPEKPDITTDSEYTIDLGDSGTTTVTGHFDYEAADKVIQLLNAYRVEQGLPELAKHDVLTEAANIRGYEVSYLFSHTRPNGSDFYYVSDEFFTYFTSLGENIASGQTTPEMVMEGWKNSPGHNANMLGDFSSVGVACFVSEENGRYVYNWVQIFGK